MDRGTVVYCFHAECPQSFFAGHPMAIDDEERERVIHQAAIDAGWQPRVVKAVNGIEIDDGVILRIYLCPAHAKGNS